MRNWTVEQRWDVCHDAKGHPGAIQRDDRQIGSSVVNQEASGGLPKPAFLLWVTEN